jgi:MHS family proline/betaine transporter-like MFS transporter
MSASSHDLAAPGHPHSARRLIIGTTIGNTMEFFDLTVYSFFAVLIGKLFFPTQSGQAQLLLSVATFGVGFVTRPVGGIFLGIFADRYGRVAAMKLTFLMMAIGTGLVGVIPTYAQIGVAAPILIVIARLLQGLSAGGEVGASTTLLVEQAPPNKRAYFASWQLASQGGAAALGALIGAWLSHSLSQAALESWGWRIPFIAGILIAPIGFYLRGQLHEDTSDVPERQVGNPLSHVLKNYPRMVFSAFGIVVGGTASFFIVLFYISTYAIKVLHLPMSSALLSGILGGVIVQVLTPISGWLCDLQGRCLPILQGSRLVQIVLVYPAFVLLQHYPSVSTLLWVVGVLSALHAITNGAVSPLLTTIFPKEVRVTGMSFTYAMAVTIFGGFAQFIVTWLIDVTGNLNSPAWYLIGCGLFALFAAALIKERPLQQTI